ncbi:TIGR02234 family membrane protein [Streptomyces sp. NBC_01808]|uniref:TIGR02234 family membrane protein n=1 Tax=Streptomyces sp. NBC_01808 TaxID=2975947 RepID=UPI002DD7AF34|nr:TIGR02234 family membrane protein [Streptomyces sp. NBC_01808]WSA37225.1 TIGR02234 family membrane protein [Streptomyces sp. NBC_01808]
MTYQSASRAPLAAALLSGALGAAVVLVAAGRTWAEGEAATPVADAVLHVTAGGRDVTGVPSALAIVGLAALVAVFAVRRAGRTVVAALLTLCGVGVIAASALGASDTAALDDQAAEAAGLTDATVTAVSHTAWAWVSLAGGVLLLCAGLLALRYGPGWPAMSGRYERPGAGAAARPRRAAPVDPERPEELWKALDRGEDPTRER